MESYRISFGENWLIPLSIILLRFIHVVAYHDTFFLLKLNNISLEG